MRKFHRMPQSYDDVQIHLDLNTSSQAARLPVSNGYRLPTATEWKMGASFAEPTQWNYETAAGMAHRVPSSVAVNRLADYWGNVSEMLWEGGDKGDCIGSSANDSAKAIATTFCTLEMYQTDTLRGFRLVRTDVQQAIKVSPRQQTWKSNGIAVPVVTVPQTGVYALQVKGSGYRTLETGLLDSREFSQVGDQLQVDLRIPAEQPNPWWIGEMALQIDIPSAGIYSQELGRRSLQGFVYGDWNTLDFALNSKVQTALLGTHADVRFKVILNVSSPGEWLLGNFRMAGNLTARSGQVLTPSLKQQEQSQTLGFELASGWTTPSGAVSVTQSLYTQGSAALQVSASGWMPLTSARINSATLFHSSTKALGFDLFIPIPQPNPWWTGTVQVGVSCTSAGVYNQILGQVDLTKLTQGKFHHLQVPVPSSLATKLSQSYDDLQIHLNLNTASQAGPFVFDGLQGE